MLLRMIPQGWAGVPCPPHGSDPLGGSCSDFVTGQRIDRRRATEQATRRRVDNNYVRMLYI